MDELEEYKEEVEGKVDFDRGGEVNYVPFVYPRGTVSVSSLGPFLSVGSSSKPSHPFCLSLSEHTTFKSISSGRGVENENSLIHGSRRPGRRSG